MTIEILKLNLKLFNDFELRTQIINEICSNSVTNDHYINNAFYYNFCQQTPQPFPKIFFFLFKTIRYWKFNAKLEV